MVDSMPDSSKPDAGILRAVQVIWLNLMFYSLYFLMSAIFIPAAALYVAAFGLTLRNRRRTMWLTRRCISYYGAATIRCGWPLVRVQYIDLAPEERPPFVFVCNHRSASDAYLIGFLPLEAIQVLNIWPTKLPILGFLARIAGYLSIREMPFEEFLRDGSALLAQGVSIVTFPEGTRARTSEVQSFHGSAFRLAQQAGVPVAPLVIEGNEMIPPRGSMFLHPGRIRVSKLPAVTSEQYRDLSPFQLKMQVRETIQQHLNPVQVPGSTTIESGV